MVSCCLPEFGDVIALARIAAHAQLTPMVLQSRVLDAAVGACSIRRIADTVRDEPCSILGGPEVALPHEALACEDAIRGAVRRRALIVPKGETFSPMVRRTVLTGFAVTCGVGILCASHADSETCP